MLICWYYGRKYIRIENAYLFIIKVTTGSLLIIITNHIIKLFNFDLFFEIILITAISILSYFIYGIIIKNEIILQLYKTMRVKLNLKIKKYSK